MVTVVEFLDDSGSFGRAHLAGGVTGIAFRNEVKNTTQGSGLTAGDGGDFAHRNIQAGKLGIGKTTPCGGCCISRCKAAT